MTENNLAAAMASLRQLTAEQKYNEAGRLCQQLFAQAEQRAGCGDILQELAEINAVIVIESDDRPGIPEAAEQLKKYAGGAYSSFLLARLAWQDKKHLQALLALERDFQLQWQEGRLLIPPGSGYWQASGEVRAVICNLLAFAYKFFGVPEQAAHCYLLASRTGTEAAVQQADYSNYLFNLHYLFLTREEYWQAHLGYDELFAGAKRLLHDRKLAAERYCRRKKIRIGYISPDFRHHVVLLFIWAMLTKYNAEEFEVYLFSNSRIEDKYSGYLQQQVQFWCNISSLSALQAAQVIQSQEIDILVELAGHSKDNCLPVLAYKPAPVQICGIGYFATTGLQTVDYFLTDSYLVNGDSARYFTEKLLVLPHSHFCYTALRETTPVQGAPCRRKGYVTFGSFNHLTKVNDTVLRVWAALLQQVPNSRLLLKCATLDDAAARELMHDRLTALGVSEERFELRGFSLDYLQEYYELDIALDTFPYPGGGTTCDALYMGVPVITLGDGTHGGNFGISLLKNIGLDFACAENAAEYIAGAKVLAEDAELLDALHLGLRRMMEESPVMDEQLYMKELEGAYHQIWADYLHGRD